MGKEISFLAHWILLSSRLFLHAYINILYNTSLFFNDMTQLFLYIESRKK